MIHFLLIEKLFQVKNKQTQDNDSYMLQQYLCKHYSCVEAKTRPESW